MIDENKNVIYFVVFVNFVIYEKFFRYMVNGYLFLLFGIYGCFGIMFFLKFYSRFFYGF